MDSPSSSGSTDAGLGIYPIPVKEGIDKYDFIAYVGNNSGIFKGVDFRKDMGPKCVNILAPRQISEITAMAWGDEDECDVLIALKNCMVRVFNSKYKKNFVKCLPTDVNEGTIQSVSRYNNVILTAFESGVVKTMKTDADDQLVLNTGKHLCKMRHCEVNGDLIATGGLDHNLKLWDLPTKTCLFQAKNLKPDELQLKVPVFVSDICFIPSTLLVATCSKNGYVNLYDTRSSSRRPTLNTVIKDHAFTCIASAPRERHIVVGSGTGQMYLLDMRKPNKSASRYKGFQGGISAIACHKTEPYIVSTSLDHYFRIHNLNTTNLVYKSVNASPLHFLLLRSDFSFEEDPCVSGENEDDVVVLDEGRLRDDAESRPDDMPKKIKYSAT